MSDKAFKPVIKPLFEQRYTQLLGNDYDEFIKTSLTYLRRSIRINTLKISKQRCLQMLEKNFNLTPVPWCDYGFWISHSERRDTGNTLAHTLGYIYIQEAASMIPVEILHPEPDDRVLDMCASPGSKSTQIAQAMRNSGLLVANDFKGMRIQSLGINIQRCGVTNAIITESFGQGIRGIEFDKILVDAPCSGTGAIRKSFKTFQIWNPGMISRLSSQQKKLVKNAFNLLKPGGTLVYSTCSVEPEENEEVISALLEEFPNAAVERIELKIKRSEPIMSFNRKQYHPAVSNCLRIWPQDNDTEGFFVAKIKKAG